MAKSEVIIGKFPILATYTYAKDLLGGETTDEANQRGIVIPPRSTIAVIAGPFTHRGSWNWLA
jgi:hypothetical protein